MSAAASGELTTYRGADDVMLVCNCMEADDQQLASHKPICGLGDWSLLQQRPHV